MLQTAGLKGRAPFGGHILSHDFVEAALIRRGGWSAWLLPELKGSFEECPPSMIDFAVRDRRWCQGNMQHMKVLVSKGLHPVSRVHFIIGIMSYLSSPLWLSFLLVGLATALGRNIFQPEYFPTYYTLFPTWPILTNSVPSVCSSFPCSCLFSQIPGVNRLSDAKQIQGHRRLFRGGQERAGGNCLQRAVGTDHDDVPKQIRI